MQKQYDFAKRLGTCTLLLALAILDPQGAFAACTDTRLDTDNGPMAAIPVMDQDGKPICYAYAASQMADAWRFSHGDTDKDHLTSPVALAVFYSAQRKDRPAKDIDQGWQADALDMMSSYGSCDYNSVFTKMGKSGLGDYFSSLKADFDQFKLQAAQSSLKSNAAQTHAQAIHCSLASSGMSTIPDVSAILTALDQPTYVKYLEKIFKSACVGHTKKMDLPATTQKWANDYPASVRVEKFTQLMNDELTSSNPQPIGINYCENILFNKNTRGINEKGAFNWQNCDDQHISVVIGQRQTSVGGCEFLVRNSHGKTCNSYPDWDCEKDSGELWIDSEALARNLYGLSWLGK